MWVPAKTGIHKIRANPTDHYLNIEDPLGNIFVAFDEFLTSSFELPVIIGTQGGPDCSIYIQGTATKIARYRNIDTAGFGVAPIYASHSSIGNTGAVANAINYAPPAIAGRYRITGVVDVTAWTTPASFTVQVTYRDDSGVSRTETLQVIRGSTGVAAAAITAIDRWYFILPVFAINNGQIAITLSTTGTFTGSPVYNLSAVLEQLA